MYLAQWLPKLIAVKDFVYNRLLPPYPEAIHHKQLS